MSYGITIAITPLLKSREGTFSVNLKSILFSILAFLIPALGAGGFVSASVSSHLTKASYAPAEIELARVIFFAATFLLAGLFGLAMSKAWTFRQQKCLSIFALVVFLLIGLIFANVSLTDFYDNPSGPVTEWFFNSLGAFCLFGLLPATLAFVFSWLKNRPISRLDEAVESPSSVS